MNHHLEAGRGDLDKTLSELGHPLESSTWFPSRLSIEEGGIERITEEQRGESKQKFWNATTFW